MRNLSRNTRKNKRKNKVKSQKKKSMNDNKETLTSTPFANNELGIILQKVWIEEHREILIKNIRESNAQFILVSPQKQGKKVVAQVNFCNMNDFQRIKFPQFQIPINPIVSYYEKMKGEDNLVIFFLNKEGRLSCYTIDSQSIICDEVSPSAFYQIKGNKVVIDFELLKWLYNMEDRDIARLKRLEYFPNNERIKDLNGVFQVIDPVSVALYDFIEGCKLIYEDAKKSGFRKTQFLIDENGNTVNFYDKEQLENDIAHGKSIFKRIKPDTYKKFFNDNNSEKKAS